MNMNVYGIEGLWNLIWIIPLCIGIGFFISAFWPSGKGFEGPPYVSFDPGENYTGRHRFDEPQSLVDIRIFDDTPHPGKLCGPACWRKPDGHRWGDEH